jgi:chemotaxis protein MotA
MIPATFLGMALAVGSLLAMMLLEGSSPLAVVLLPPLILVFGATFGAAVAGSTTADLRHLGRWFRMAFAADRDPQSTALIAQLVDLATIARKEGMLPLENRARHVADPFLRHGLQMAVDGVPIEQLRRVMEREIDARRLEDRVAARFFAKMGGYAPTIGIIGTVVGLVQVLQSLEDPQVLGPLVATAFVATLWGVLSANFMWLPISTKITRTSDQRAAEMDLLMEGVSEILAGTNPRALRQKLTAMVPPSEVGRSAA